jgi:ABC-type nitrate/sulfonate/bicarbonate transport system substrate-binding protein
VLLNPPYNFGFKEDYQVRMNAVILLLIFFATILPCRVDAQDKLTKFRFVHLEANGSQAVPFIAKEAKVFEKNGLDVEIIRIGGGSRVIQAMLAGEIKVAHGSSPAVVEANLAGADLVIIASTVKVATFQSLLQASRKSQRRCVVIPAQAKSQNGRMPYAPCTRTFRISGQERTGLALAVRALDRAA